MLYEAKRYSKYISFIPFINGNLWKCDFTTFNRVLVLIQFKINSGIHIKIFSTVQICTKVFKLISTKFQPIVLL